MHLLDLSTQGKIMGKKPCIFRLHRRIIRRCCEKILILRFFGKNTDFPSVVHYIIYYLQVQWNFLIIEAQQMRSLYLK